MSQAHLVLTTDEKIHESGSPRTYNKQEDNQSGSPRTYNRAVNT